MLEVWIGTKGGELVEIEIITTASWRLDALEMLADRALEMLVNGEYGEAQRILSVMSSLIAEIQDAFNEEE